SWLKSLRKYCTSLRPSPSRQARPTIKATVPVPPDSPVVSVSRNNGPRSSSGANPRHVANALTSPSPCSVSHSRRTSTGPNGVSSSAQFAGSRPAVPPPRPPPPVREGDPEPSLGKGLVERGGRAAIAAIRARSAMRSAVTLPAPALPARGDASPRPFLAPPPRAPGLHRTDSHSRTRTATPDHGQHQ